MPKNRLVKWWCAIQQAEPKNLTWFEGVFAAMIIKLTQGLNRIIKGYIVLQFLEGDWNLAQRISTDQLNINYFPINIFIHHFDMTNQSL